MTTYSEKYKDFIVKDKKHAGFNSPDGSQTLYHFPNNYGASVIRSQFSRGLEAAVLWFNPEGKATITYSTSVTDDVVNYIDDLEFILEQIKSLDCWGNKASEYKYTYKHRGFSIGCQPDDFVRFYNDENYKYEVIVYDRKLTESELEEYELEVIT